MAQLTQGDYDQQMKRNQILSINPNAQLPSYLTAGMFQDELNNATLAMSNQATAAANPANMQQGGGASYGNISPQLLNETQTSLGTSLRGELPADVQNLLRQQAAEYGVANGMPGSQFAGYRGLKNLGLTSLDQSNKAQDILKSFLTSPLQAGQLAVDQGRLGLQQQGYANQNAQQNMARMDQQNAQRRQQANDWNNQSMASSSPSVTYGMQPRQSYSGGNVPQYQQQQYQQPSYQAPSAQPYTWYSGTASEPLNYQGKADYFSDWLDA